LLLYQGGTFPATAFHHRRRVARFMFEPLGYVNTWTEFLVSPVGALAAFVEDYDDAALLGELWQTTGSAAAAAAAAAAGPDAADGESNNSSSAFAEFSLTNYYDAARSLVVGTPKPLVDWPRSSALDIDGSTARVCDKLCVEMNGHAATAQAQMAALARRLGRDDEAAVYAGRAAAIRAAANATFRALPEQCTPAGIGACFADEPNVPPTPTPPTPPPAPTPAVTCGMVLEKDRFQTNTTGLLTLDCGAGSVVAAVAFADFGTPGGSCAGGGGFRSNASCTDAGGAAAVVNAACAGKRGCTLSADVRTFTDPCAGVPKRLAVAVSCSPGGSGGSGGGGSSSGSGGGGTAPSPPLRTTAHASVFALDARIPGSAAAGLALVPFLRARNARRGHAHGLEVSGWVAGFMLRGLYGAAGEVGEGDVALPLAADAAALAWETLVHNGTNSWLGGMVGRMNATMTTESWVIPDEGGGTMSHPWTDAPAYIVPRYLMGVRPLEGGWRRIAVRPLPPAAELLPAAALVTPTPRASARSLARD